MNFSKPSLNSRMDMGHYALNKLASAGAIMLLLTALSWIWPQGSPKPAAILGAKIPLEHWVYGYALIASLAADAVLSFLPYLNRLKQAAVYAAAGFLFFALLVNGSQDALWIRGAAGMIVLLMYLWGKQLFTGQSLFTVFFALVVPLLCWAIL